MVFIAWGEMGRVSEALIIDSFKKKKEKGWSHWSICENSRENPKYLKIPHTHSWAKTQCFSWRLQTQGKLAIIIFFFLGGDPSNVDQVQCETFQENIYWFCKLLTFFLTHVALFQNSLSVPLFIPTSYSKRDIQRLNSGLTWPEAFKNSRPMSVPMSRKPPRWPGRHHQLKCHR